LKPSYCDFTTQLEFTHVWFRWCFQVAVKLLPLAGPKDCREALQREVAVLLKAASHSHHVSQVLGLTVKDGKLAIAMRKYACNLTAHIASRPGVVV
jgi:hypothetical protein